MKKKTKMGKMEKEKQMKTERRGEEEEKKKKYGIRE